MWTGARPYSHVTVTFQAERPKDKAGAINPAFDDLYPSEG